MASLSSGLGAVRPMPGLTLAPTRTGMVLLVRPRDSLVLRPSVAFEPGPASRRGPYHFYAILPGRQEQSPAVTLTGRVSHPLWPPGASVVLSRRPFAMPTKVETSWV